MLPIHRAYKTGIPAKPPQTIDYLNLRLGIVHGDISMWNLLIDPETDDLKVFDFNMGAKVGWEGNKDENFAFGYKESRNDVKMVIFTFYEIVTRDLSFREKDYFPSEFEAGLALGRPNWKQHPDVRLEEDVNIDEYRRVLKDWVSARRQMEPLSYKQAPDFIDWPSLPQFPLMGEEGAKRRSPGELRQCMIRRGEPFIKWCVSLPSKTKTWLMILRRQRPPTCRIPLPAGQRLLATGEIIHDSPLE